MNEVLTGTEFNAKYHGQLLVKCLPGSLMVSHCDLNTRNYSYFQWRKGLNVDVHPFDASKGYKGLHFCFSRDVRIWKDESRYLIFAVSVPNDAQVVVMDNKIKADRLILGEEMILFGDELVTKEKLEYDMRIELEKKGSELNSSIFSTQFRRILEVGVSGVFFFHNVDLSDEEYVSIFAKFGAVDLIVMKASDRVLEKYMRRHPRYMSTFVQYVRFLEAIKNTKDPVILDILSGICYDRGSGQLEEN